MSSYSDYLKQPKSKNVLHNGNFVIWQRGTSFPAAGTTYTADRWVFGETGATVVCSVTGDGNVPNSNSNWCLQITSTTPQASFTGAEYVNFQQRIEGYDFQKIANKTVTFSFWAYATVGGTYSCFFRNSAYSHSLIKEFELPSNAWKYVQVTFYWDASIATYTYDETHSANIGFAPACGSTYATSTIGEWVSGNYIASTNQVNFASGTNNVFRVSQVQLEVGAVATDFDHLNITDQWRICKRYYEVTSYLLVPATAVGSGNGTYYAQVSNYPKRSTPTSYIITGPFMWNPVTGWRTPTATSATAPGRLRTILIFQDTGYAGYVAGNVGLIQSLSAINADL